MSFSLPVKILLILVGTYIAAGIILFGLQEKFLFHPDPLPLNHKYDFQQPHTEYNSDLNGRNLNMIQFHSRGTSKGIVLYFHGNRDNIGRYAHMASFFTEAGYDVWMQDYPGFGKSTGELSERTLYDDAELMYSSATKDIPLENIIIYGRSIGSGIAAHLAAKRHCRALILETPYYSVTSLVKHYVPFFPVEHLLWYRLPTYEYLPAVRAPVTIFHGTNDRLIPYSQAEKLKKENPPIKLVTIEGGQHNDLFRHAAFKQGLDSVLKY